MADLHAATTSYPAALDTATTLRDDVTPGDGTGDLIRAIHQNGPASAIIAIETALGVNPFGSAPDVATRLNTGLNPSGTVKVDGGTVTPNRLLFGGSGGALSTSPWLVFDPTTGQLRLDAQGASAGLRLGTDAFLYRGGANLLRTPGSVQIDGALTVSGSTAVQGLSATAVTVTPASPSVAVSVADNSALKVGTASLSAGGGGTAVARLGNNAWYNGTAWQIAGPGALVQLAGQDTRFYTHDALGTFTERFRVLATGEVGVPGNLVVGGPASIGGNASISGTLNVTGSTTLAGLTAGATSLSSLTLPTPLATSSGGTGRSTIGSANQLLGVDAGGGALEYKTIQGTANRVSVTHSAGAITLSAPQDLHTGASPTFNALTLTGTGTVLTVANTATFVAYNSGGSLEAYLWPRWSDNAMYLNYGAGGFLIRNNFYSTAMFIYPNLSVYMAGPLSIGSNPAQSGIICLPNNQAIVARNGANTSDIALIGSDTHDSIVIGYGDLTIAGGKLGIRSGWPVHHLLQLGAASAGQALTQLFINQGAYNTWNNSGVQISPDGNSAVGGLLSALFDTATNTQYVALGTLGYSGVPQTLVISNGSVGVRTLTQFGGGSGVIGIANATTVPTSNPSGGLVLYADGGLLHYRSPSGMIVKLDQDVRIGASPAFSTVSLGSSPAQSGALRLPNNQAIVARNAANTGDRSMMWVDASNRLSLDAGSTRLRIDNGVIYDPGTGVAYLLITLNGYPSSLVLGPSGV